MKYTGVNFSLADKINSAKTQTTARNNTSDVPTRVNPSPGDPSMSVDTSNIDNAGTNISQQQNTATDATSPAKSREVANKAKDLEYQKPLDATYPREADPGKVIPTPKSKGFAQRLLDAQMANNLIDTNRPQPNTRTAEYPKEQGTNINKPQPEDNTPTRPNPGVFDPSGISTINPKAPSGDLLGNIPGDAPGTTPEGALGPLYTAPGQYKAPNTPKGFTAPKLNLPKFK
jgi:hypothetical protein